MKILFCPALLLLSTFLPTTAADGSVNGPWHVHASIAGNESDQDCTFTQSGRELTGTCVSASGKVQISGKVEENKVSWSFQSEYNGTPLTVNYSGTLASGKITGTVSVPEFSVDGEFTAAPSK